MQSILRSSYGLLMPILAMAFWGCAHSGELPRPDRGKKIKVFLFAGQSNMEGRFTIIKVPVGTYTMAIRTKSKAAPDAKPAASGDAKAKPAPASLQ